MKVYVDELCSSCSSCPFFQDELLNCCASDDKELDFTFSKDFNRILQRHPNCPLQSLFDYTKQVRKEVCEEIRDKMIMYGKKTIYNDCGDAIGIRECLSLNEIKNILDQIQGETNET